MMGVINMNDILSANLVNVSGNLRAEFKKTVNVRQYESETVTLSVLAQVDESMTGPERLLTSAVLSAQVEYAVLVQLYFKKQISETEFVERRAELENEVQSVLNKAEELEGRSLAGILHHGIKPTKREAGVGLTGFEDRNSPDGQKLPGPPKAEAPAAPTAEAKPEEEVQVTSGIPGATPVTAKKPETIQDTQLGAGGAAAGGLGGIPGMGAMPVVPGVVTERIPWPTPAGPGVPGTPGMVGPQ